MSKRVYHPTNNAWQDVPDKDVEAWKAAGWHKTKPKHVDDAGSRNADQFHTPALIVTDQSNGPIATVSVAADGAQVAE